MTRYKIVIIAAFSLLSIKTLSQTKENVNPKGNWFFGAEIGQNSITSYNLGESDKSVQGGVLAEYYFARHWSLSGKIKYYEIGVSFYQQGTSGWFGSPSTFVNFSGAVISVPLNIKWEFRISKNLGGSLKLGYVYNFETESNYAANTNTDYPKQYGGINAGYGFNYFINNNYAVYLDIESFNGGEKGLRKGFLGDSYIITQNSLVSLGFKYNFKNYKQEKTTN